MEVEGKGEVGGEGRGWARMGPSTSLSPPLFDTKLRPGKNKVSP